MTCVTYSHRRLNFSFLGEILKKKNTKDEKKSCITNNLNPHRKGDRSGRFGNRYPVLFTYETFRQLLLKVVTFQEKNYILLLHLPVHKVLQE